jgi:thiosulfate dehydrogenase
LACNSCHGDDGLTIDFGGGEGVGDHADDDPQEFQHKVRFGNPGTAMPSSVTNGATDAEVNNVGTYAQQSL